MLYILYNVDDPAVSKRIRAELLQDHLAYLARHDHLVFLGGAMLAEDGSTRVGSSLILNAPDYATADEFARNEPYRKAGLYASTSLRRMRRAQWNPARAPASVDGN